MSELSIRKIFKIREENHSADFKGLTYEVFVLILAREWLPETFSNPWFQCCLQVSNLILKLSSSLIPKLLPLA